MRVRYKDAVLFCAVMNFAACSFSVRPSAEDIEGRLVEKGAMALEPWLERRGFRSWSTTLESHPDRGKDCVEKANAAAMIFVGGVDVVRVCRVPETGQVEVTHIHTHGVGKVVRTYDPVTMSIACKDSFEEMNRCAK